MQIIDINVEKVLLYPEFEILCPTTVFAPRRFVNQPAQKEPLSPLRLPDYEDQCAHIDVDETTGDYTRCTREPDGKCGWLCQKHDTYLLEGRIGKAPRSSDDEVVTHIKAVEAKVRAMAVVERVRLTTKGDYITYVVG